jgi:TPR repeat protein
LSPNTPQAAHDGGDAKESVNLGLRWEQACTGGEAQGCFNLGLLYARGQGVPKDECRAATLFEQACRAGMSEACARQ